MDLNEAMRRSPELREKVERANEWEGEIAEGLRAFHAPSECGAIAYRPVERLWEEIMTTVKEMSLQEIEELEEQRARLHPTLQGTKQHFTDLIARHERDVLELDELWLEDKS